MSKKIIKYNRKNAPYYGDQSKTGSDYMRERYDIMREIGKRENFNLSDYPYSLMEHDTSPSNIEIRSRKAKIVQFAEINNPDKKAVILTVGNIHTLAYVRVKGWGYNKKTFEEAKTIATYKVTYNKKTGRKTYDKLKTLEGVKELFKPGKDLFFGLKHVINK